METSGYCGRSDHLNRCHRVCMDIKVLKRHEIRQGKSATGFNQTATVFFKIMITPP